MLPEVADWFGRRTWQPPPWTAAELVAAKRGRTVSVVLPALNEEQTVAHVVETVRAAAVPARPGDPPLVDDVLVMDGGSTDHTAQRALSAGARVVDREQALPGLAVRPGKGEVLWRALAATDADLIVFVDADLVDVEPALVVGLLGPLLTVDGVELVKGFYRRPLRLETAEAGTGGGRVTELMARPLIARFAPLAGGVVQPLGGEYAGTRELLESLPFAASYGVEIGLLLDTIATRGLDAVGQVDLGVRKHRNRTLLDLGVMAQEVLDTVLSRTAAGPSAADPRAAGPTAADPMERVMAHPTSELVQFVQQDGIWTARSRPLALADRPPMRLMRAAAARHGSIET